LMRPTSAGTMGSHKGLPLLQLERMTFRFVGAGFVVLSAALLLGAWFANPWRWDYKTVFSMLAWFVFAGQLVGRRAFGWRGPAATRWLYAGAALLLLAYVGSRFVLEVLLHRAPA
ncbi:MAG: cytochrome c biogenesis protein CcsA, partial [Burkholderiales bacterium]|nr:cytochrome c biogenesis protein CcsA [Burkholderiales bacterium]